MKININAELEGKDLADYFINQLKSQKIEVDESKIKVMVQNKAGEFIEVGLEKIKLVYNN